MTGTFIGTFTIRDMASLQAQSGSNEILKMSETSQKSSQPEIHLDILQDSGPFSFLPDPETSRLPISSNEWWLTSSSNLVI